jgi:hypothetical protein
MRWPKPKIGLMSHKQTMFADDCNHKDKETNTTVRTGYGEQLPNHSITTCQQMLKRHLTNIIMTTQKSRKVTSPDPKKPQNEERCIKNGKPKTQGSKNGKIFYRNKGLGISDTHSDAYIRIQHKEEI